MSVLDVLKKGMSTEIWGMRFYEQAAARTQAEDGKRVFESLVKEEKTHLEILCGEYAAVTQGKGCVTLEEARALAGSVDPTAIFPEAQAAEQLIPPDFSDEQALKMALDFEERGYAAYTQAAEEATTPHEKEMWAFLAKAEDKHYTFIQKTLEFLTTNGVWYFDEKELPFFEG
ncbi:MAG: ferritin family protein [Chloroflexi bacterium]|nr:ferritin family protein [Chloroflexota bacterium]